MQKHKYTTNTHQKTKKPTKTHKPTICQICSALSSLTLATVQWSWEFQLKSEILAQWPEWMNFNSGGPSSASSALGEEIEGEMSENE
jgi:hypothetical protein